MANGITGIDHGTIAVHDLEAARSNWQRLGFTLSPIGRHTGWGTANYAMAFGRNYLALIGVVDPAAPLPGRLADALAKREGMFAIALGTDDADAAYADLKAAGLNPGEVIDMARDVEVPGQSEPTRPRFRILQLPESVTPGLDVSLTQHLTPELVWRPEWQLHANGALGIAAITVVVDDPEPLLEPYEQLFGPGSCTPTDDILTIFTGHGQLTFVTPDDLNLIYPDVVIEETAQTPFIAGASLKVRATDTVADYLTQSGVPYTRSEDSTVRIAPAQANGVVVEFTQTPTT
jgi:catechol 2,3-dioxygenase-like lactoylglutathione lyase family enzyme